jgi:hypothetical protein
VLILLEMVASVPEIIVERRVCVRMMENVSWAAPTVTRAAARLGLLAIHVRLTLMTAQVETVAVKGHVLME